ncbi:hypothetical protein B0T17DRAFT_572825 [Bombardia bombarda]|uniref:Heterokaryon incompatibility domain-containing protein n=1 Tax=Bombardia bombarda TaxID=252184 RepID=A0AA39XCC8_9PEZI|nr:hypothetical protein B0T17DRAFT_572825 [Bombardia bombarda]
MDFLPHPSSGVEPLDIPFVADTPYLHGSDFWDFPKTHGFSDQWTALPAPRLASLAQSWLYFGAISEFLGRPIDYREFQASARPYSPGNEYQQHPASVSGRPLHQLLDEWLRVHIIPRLNPTLPGTQRNSDIQIDKEDQREVLWHHADFLDRVFGLAENFEQLSQGHVHPIPAVILSVKTLCIALSDVLRELARFEPGVLPMQWPSTAARRPTGKLLPSSDPNMPPRPLPSAQLLLDVLQLRGWCPFYVRKISASYNYALVYYFTRLFQRYSPELSHDFCSEWECVASNVELFSYAPKHTEPNCQCRHLNVRADKVRDIIMAGGIPVIQVSAQSRKKSTIKVVKMTPRTRFVAISHVWSDGLGNPRANGLPKCQLSRLQGYADNLDPLRGVLETRDDFGLLLSSSPNSRIQSRRPSRPRYFWIDTLCIPVGSLYDDARVQAINKMAAVYQAADRVLVLDQSLEWISVANTDICERLARLSVSPWIGRCWTFQEAAQSSVCEVQCADGTFDPFAQHLASPLLPQIQQNKKPLYKYLTQSGKTVKTLIQKLRTQPPPRYWDDGTRAVSADIGIAMAANLARPLERDFQVAYTNGVRNNKPSYDEMGEVQSVDLCTLFVQIWNELSKRSLSSPEDKHTIMASMLGFNMQTTLRLLKPEDRMSTILWSMDGLPMSLFLNHRGPRQSPAGYHRNRWVPEYPSKQQLDHGATYSNIRVVNSDLYFPNNSLSRREVSVLICTDKPEWNTSKGFMMRDVSDGRQYSVNIHREDGDGGYDLFASPEIGPYCVIIQRSTLKDQRRRSHHISKTTMPGALFRVRRIVTNVRRYYHHNLEPEYEKSYELMEAEPPGGGRSDVAGKREGVPEKASDVSVAFGQHERGILRTLYDCPVTVTCVPSDNDWDSVRPVSHRQSRLPTMQAEPLPPSWQIIIERDAPAFSSIPLPTRPSYREAMEPETAYFFVTALDGIVSSGCVGLAIAICATMLPILSPLAKVALIAKLILHSLFVIQLFMFAGMEPRLIWDVLHLILVVLYTVGRLTMGTSRGLNTLDRAFVFWSFAGHTVDFAARLIIQQAVMPALFDKYLATFGEGWRPPPEDDEDVVWQVRWARWWRELYADLGQWAGRGPSRGPGMEQEEAEGPLPEHRRSQQHLLGDMG